MNEPVLDIELRDVKKLRSGKVREIFDLGDRLLIVATDRISAFDVIMPNGIPDKGAILTQLSNFWFDRLADIAPNHLVATALSDFPDELRRDPAAAELAGRSVVVEKAEVLPVECVIRGYLAGSGWKDYQQTGAMCGIELPAGLVNGSRLDEPVFTPATKATSGHDINISEEQAGEIIGEEMATRVAQVSKRLYSEARAHAESCGLILADTKFEFGTKSGELLLIDELFTPDSSRFWDEEAYRPGEPPVNFDKQIVRDYLETLDWDKQPPGPMLPEDIVHRAREKYLEAYRRLAGKEFAPAT